MYAFGVEARRIFHNRRIADEALGLGLASLSAGIGINPTVEVTNKGKAGGTDSPAAKPKKRNAKKRKESVVSSHICV